MIRVGIVIWRAEIQEVVSIHDVEQINIAVYPEMGIQRESQKAMIPPLTDFLTDVQEE
jgi:hypothetical protein